MNLSVIFILSYEDLAFLIIIGPVLSIPLECSVVNHLRNTSTNCTNLGSSSVRHLRKFLLAVICCHKKSDWSFHSFCQGEYSVTHILINCQDIKRWRENFQARCDYIWMKWKVLKKLVRCFKTTHVMQLNIFYTRLHVSGSTTQNNQWKKMYCDGCNY